IKGKPYAKLLIVHGNDISSKYKIKDVHFGYLTGKPILNGLTMETPRYDEDHEIGEWVSPNTNAQRLDGFNNFFGNSQHTSYKEKLQIL
ncbi:hypothetical protein TELCIR_17329, partial [Teladorsagia circumcincta]